MLKLNKKAVEEDESRREEQERRRHSREVTKRVAPLVEDLGRKSEMEIKEKTRDRRRDQHHKTMDYESKIMDMKKKVMERPPIFYEPSHYYDEASRRAAAELQHHGVLREHGIDLSVMGGIGAGTARPPPSPPQPPAAAAPIPSTLPSPVPAPVVAPVVAPVPAPPQQIPKSRSPSTTSSASTE
jgi:hypothetical protein